MSNENNAVSEELTAEEKSIKRMNLLKKFVGLILYFVIIFGLSWILGHFVIQQVMVDGPSMRNTLHDGDRLIINKLSYRFDDVERFDIIIFRDPYAVDENLVKRVIGLPGEDVRIDREGNIYINEEKLMEGYGRTRMNNPGIAKETITLGEDEYFVLGDNRNNSIDSRDPSIGVVNKKQFLGTAWLRIYPTVDILNKAYYEDNE